MTVLHGIPGNVPASGVPLAIEGVGKSFAQREVLKRIDLQIPAG